MRPIFVDLLPRRTWRWIWAVAGVVLVAIASLGGWRISSALQMARDLHAGGLSPIREAAPQNAATPAISGMVNAGQAAKAAPPPGSLVKDYNRLFGSLESLVLPGARLRQARWDDVSGALRIDVELDSLARADEVTRLLNAGNDAQPWRLEAAVQAREGQLHGTWISRQASP